MAGKKFHSLRYSRASNIIKCEFCDFVSHARGIKNHLRSIHNLIATTNIVSVPEEETIRVMSSVIENGILKTVIERVEKKKLVSLYSPGCMYCKNTITVKNAKEVWEIKRGTEHEPCGDYVCKDCEKHCRKQAAHLFNTGVTELRKITAIKKLPDNAYDGIHHDGILQIGHSLMLELVKNKRGSNVSTRDPDDSRLRR